MGMVEVFTSVIESKVIIPLVYIKDFKVNINLGFNLI